MQYIIYGPQPGTLAATAAAAAATAAPVAAAAAAAAAAANVMTLDGATNISKYFCETSLSCILGVQPIY